MKDGRDVWYHEILEKADDECPAEELDAEHPLYVLYTSGSTAKPKGVLHTTGGYLTGVASTHRYVFDLRPDEDVYWCSADVGWVTGHSYIVYGPMLNGATSVMYEGAPDYPAQGHLVGAVRALRRDEVLHRAHGDPSLHEVGRRARREARPLEAEAARHGRRADQPEGVALVPRGRRRRALPDRRHVVADRDRRDHDHAAARGSSRPSRARPRGRSPASPPTSSTSATASRSTTVRDCSSSSARGRRCCARCTRRTTGSSRRTSRSSARRPTWSETPRARTRTATSGSSGGSTTS